MNTVSHSQFIFSVVTAFVLAVPAQHVRAQSASPGTFTKEAMLRDISGKVIVPGYVELAAKCRGLTNAFDQLMQTPTQAVLDDARKGWLAAAQSAGRMRCFQAGPVIERDYASSFYYWEVLPARIEAAVESARPVNPSLVDELGATAKGLFAIEYLLFDRKGEESAEPGRNAPTLESLSGSASERRRIFLMALAQDLELKAAQLAKDWTASGQQSSAGKFIAGGQESINVLVNQLTKSIEDATERHLNFVLVLPHPVSRQLYRIERSRSSSSLQGVLASLEGARLLFCGADGLGLDDLLKRLNAPLEKRVQEQFAATITATRAIGAPLEQAVVDNRASVQSAYEKAHALEILLKVDVASALGVTLTFSSTDGD